MKGAEIRAGILLLSDLPVRWIIRESGLQSAKKLAARLCGITLSDLFVNATDQIRHGSILKIIQLLPEKVPRFLISRLSVMIWDTFCRSLRQIMANRIAIHLISFYQRYLSPLKAPACRFYPSCSQYAIDSLRKYGLLRGFCLSLWRLLKCHPFHPGGYDPVK